MAALLCSCEKEEEFAALDLCICALTREDQAEMRLIEMHLTWNMRQLLCLRENMAIGIQIQENFSRNFIFLWNCFGKIKIVSIRSCKIGSTQCSSGNRKLYSC